MTIGSGMPDIGGGVLTEPQTSPGPDNLQIVAPQIGEPTLAGENPDFIADYIFCNNLYIRGSITGPGAGGGFPLRAPDEKPVPYSFQSHPNTGMYIHYDSGNDTWQTHIYSNDPSWYDADLFTDRGSWVMNAPGGGIQLYCYGSDFYAGSGQRWYAYLLGRKGSNAAGIGMGGQPAATAGVQMPFWIENQLYSDIVFKTVYAGGFGNINWVISGDNNAGASATGGHLQPGATSTYDIGAASPALFVRKGYINAVQLGSGCATLLSGSGVPGAGLGVNGDFYFRIDGAAGSSLYMKRAGAWAAATGV